MRMNYLGIAVAGAGAYLAFDGIYSHFVDTTGTFLQVPLGTMVGDSWTEGEILYSVLGIVLLILGLKMLGIF